MKIKVNELWSSMLEGRIYRPHYLDPVSYTHLDVYKRQGLGIGFIARQIGRRIKRQRQLLSGAMNRRRRWWWITLPICVSWPKSLRS